MPDDGDGRGSEAKISVYPVTVYRERVNRYIKDYVGYVVDKNEGMVYYNDVDFFIILSFEWMLDDASDP